MRKIATTVIATFMVTASGAHAAQAARCLTGPEATAVITAVLPDLIDGVAKRCVTVLPQTATLRGGLEPLLLRYRAAADVAWPQASLAIAKLWGKDMTGTSPDVIRPLLGSVIANMIGKDIKLGECPQIDRIAGGLAPLPPQNLADVFVAVLEVSGKDGKKSDLSICPTDATTAAAP